MEIKTSQAELDEVFERLKKDYGALNKKQQAYAIREIGRIRGDISDMLADYAGKDGVIKRNRLKRIMRDLDDIEEGMLGYGEKVFDKIASDTSDWTSGKITGVAGISISASQIERVNKYVVKYITKRFGEDGLILSDRIWGISGDVRDDISKVIRSNVIKGEGIQSMIPQIRKAYDAQTWQIERLARTEGVTAHRAATAYNAQDSDVVKYVQFHDGGPDEHHDKHKCLELAQRDPYGKGAGVYKPDDTEIWMPHPNCTSYISYVLDERWL